MMWPCFVVWFVNGLFFWGNKRMDAGVPEETVLLRLQQLPVLLPDLYNHRSVAQLKPALLARMALDPTRLIKQVTTLKVTQSIILGVKIQRRRNCVLTLSLMLHRSHHAW